MEKFSVSICVYYKDNPDWFKLAIDSILNQTVSPDEIVLVVDGPIPSDLLIIVNELEKNPIFKIIKLERNQGHGKARNIGLENCRNDLVALMDSDDISINNRFENQLKCFEKNVELSIVGGQVSEFYDNPNSVVAYRVVPQNNDEIYKYIKKRCPFNQPSVMFRKKDILDVGGYIDWYCDEDYYLWIRLCMAGKKMENVSDVLVNMRISLDSYKRRGGFKYYLSEKKLQKYMLKNHLIGIRIYIINVIKRFIVQVLLPSRIRGWVFRKFARKAVRV